MRFKKELLLGMLVASAFFAAETISVRADVGQRGLRAGVDEDCRKFRAANPGSDVCAAGDGQPGVVKLLKPAKERVKDARAALDRGDRMAAEHALVDAMDTATTIARRHTLIGDLIATAIVDDALPVLESKSLHQDSLQTIMRHAPLRLGDRALEAVRVERNFGLVYAADQDRFFSAGFGDSLLNGVVKDNGRVFGAMQSAVDSGDLAACESARDLRGSLATSYSMPFEERMCDRFIRVHATGARLNRLRRQS